MELAIEPPVRNPGAPYLGKVVVMCPFWLIVVIFIRSRSLSGPGRGVFRFGQHALALRTGDLGVLVVGIPGHPLELSVQPLSIFHNEFGNRIDCLPLDLSDRFEGNLHVCRFVSFPGFRAQNGTIGFD